VSQRRQGLPRHAQAVRHAYLGRPALMQQPTAAAGSVSHTLFLCRVQQAKPDHMQGCYCAACAGGPQACEGRGGPHWVVTKSISRGISGLQASLPFTGPSASACKIKVGCYRVGSG
jgi:hypothetical protein